MREGDFSRAQSQLEFLLQDGPDNVEALYCLAVCQRKQARHDAALATLAHLFNIDSDNARAYQERGYVLREQNRPQLAIEAFEYAVTLNPALFASWRVLASMEQYPKAAEAARQAQWLQQLPNELVSVTSLLHQKQYHQAENLCRSFLRGQPHHPEAMRLLAAIATKLQIYDDAEVLLDSCLALHPTYIRSRLDYVEVLHKRQKFDLALNQAQQLMQSDQNNPAFLLILGHAQQGCGKFDAAVQSYQRVKQLAPQHTPADIALGNALKTIGQTEAAIDAYQQAIETETQCGEAYWSLSNLKTYRFDGNQIHSMQALLEQASLSEVDRTHLCFALGKAFEDREDYSTSYSYYEQGNQLRATQVPYDRARLERALNHQRQNFDEAFFAERAGAGHTAPDPIFIVGLPRAGSTLLEQILSAHSQVDATMELSNIISMAHAFSARRAGITPRQYPNVLGELSVDELRQLGEQYLADTQHLRQGAPLFIDKMPNNFRHVALIKLILPNAKIIDARRDPMACCFSGYKQLFAEGQEFSYELEDLAHYYSQYVSIMQHWDTVLPDAVLRVYNEQLIEDPEGQIRRMLTYCGLEFEEGCLKFHENKRAVRTPSSEQVRQPIYRSAMHQWQHYAAHLKPLSESFAALDY